MNLISRFTAACLALMAMAGACAGGGVPGAENSVAPFRGIKVHYKDTGHGRPVLVFVHGWNCNLTFWEQSLDAFPEHRVISIDLPGHGDSDKPHLQYSTEYFASSVDAVLNHAGVDRAILIGHSMGARVVHQLNVLHPEKALGLVLVDGMPWSSRKLKHSDLEQLIETYRLDYANALDLSLNELLSGIKDPAIKQSLRSQMKATPEHVGFSAAQATIREDIDQLTAEGDLLAGVADHSEVITPVLAIFAGGGEGYQSWWPTDTEEFLRRSMKNLDFRWWNNVSHFLMIERPDAFNDVIRRFADGVIDTCRLPCAGDRGESHSPRTAAMPCT